MFLMTHVIDGRLAPVISITVENAAIPFTKTLTLQALNSDTRLDWTGPSAQVRFVGGDGSIFPFPLSGQDFLNAREGTLYVSIEEALPFGVYQAWLTYEKPLPSVCGYGILGMVQGGQLLEAQQKAPVVLRIQSLPANTLTLSATTVSAQPPVDVVLD